MADMTARHLAIIQLPFHTVYATRGYLTLQIAKLSPSFNYSFISAPGSVKTSIKLIPPCNGHRAHLRFISTSHGVVRILKRLLKTSTSTVDCVIASGRAGAPTAPMRPQWPGTGFFYFSFVFFHTIPGPTSLYVASQVGSNNIF